MNQLPAPSPKGQSLSAHPDFAAPQLPLRPTVNTSNLVADPQSRPRSASRLTPPTVLQANRKRFYSVSSTLPPIPSASLNPMDWSWSGVSRPLRILISADESQSDPVFAPSNNQYSLPSSHDEKRALGLDPGHGTGYLGLNTQQGVNYLPPPLPQHAAPYSGYQDMPFRPTLALDTSGPSFQHPQVQLPSAQSSAPPTGILSDSTSVHDGERVITPGFGYGFPPQYSGYTPTFHYDQHQPYSAQQPQPGNPSQQPQQSHPAPDMSHWAPQYQAQQPYYQDFQPPPPTTQHQHQGTISPSQLGHAQLNSDNKPLRTFSDLMLNSRGSSSSASSTEGGTQDFVSVLEDWKPMQRALIPPSHTSPLPPSQPTVPEPARRNEVHFAVPPAPKTKNLGFVVPGSLPSVPNPDALQGALQSYISSPNRLAFGERKITVMSPKVGQKSYGTEKRFLCPHPQATLVGPAWWSPAADGCPAKTRMPPRVNISLEGEHAVKDAQVSWTTVDGRNLDEKINTQTLKEEEIPFIGNVAGKNLHISDADSKRREAKARVVVKAPYARNAGQHGWGPTKGTMKDISNDEIIGAFESKEIKIISKPSKKKASTKSTELLIQHGTTVALFNRVKSQTTSTRYLSITPDPTRILGSDGRPVSGAVPPPCPPGRTVFPDFTANAQSWESWIIWLADPSRPPGPSGHPPLHPDWPPAPNNALFGPHFSPPIRYNSTVILQSLQTGKCSPVLIVRRVEQDDQVVGGDGTLQETLQALPEGEFAGDLLSQLQKCAFEIYRPDQQYMAPPDPRWGGVWLSCNQEMIEDKIVKGDRKWAPVPMAAPGRGGSRPNSLPSTPSSRYGVLPMTPHTNIAGLPSVGSPSVPSSPNSTSSSLDYFGAHSRKASSTSLYSPANHDVALPSTDGGPVRRHRTGSASAARGPFSRPAHRKRQSGEMSANSSFEWIQSAQGSPGETHRVFWSLNIGDDCIWSIVSTEQITYTFYVPDYVTSTSEPYAPMPSVSRLISPDAPNDAGRLAHPYTPRTNKPLVTVYGKGFQKNTDNAPHHLVYYGADPAEYNEGRW